MQLSRGAGQFSDSAQKQKADSRDVDDHRQGDQESDDERNGFLRDIHWRALRQVSCDEHVKSEGRSCQTDGQAADQDNTEVDVVDAKAHHCRQKHRKGP